MTNQWQAALREHPAQLIDTDWGPLSCRTGGHGPDLVLLHGIGSGSGSWANQLASLSNDFRITAWDMPGYGDSQRVDSPTCGAYASALTALLVARSVSWTVMVGHSLGALVAACFARRRPERIRGLVLASPARGHAHLSEAERRDKRETRLQRFTELGPQAHADSRAAALLSADADADQKELVRLNMARLHLAGYADAAQLLSDGDLLTEVANIDLPCRVLCGGADTITSPTQAIEVAAAFPGGREYREIAGAGHACYIESPTEFDKEVRAFVETLA